MTSQHQLTVDNPQSLSQRYFSITRADVPYLCSAAIVIATARITTNTLVAFVVFVVAALFFAKYSPKGRAYYVLLKKLDSWKIRRPDKGVLWLAPSGKASKNRRIRLRRRQAEVLPVKVQSLQHIGLAHNKGFKTDSIVVVGDGSDDAALSLAAQRQKIAEKAQTIMRLASRPDVGVGVSFVFRKHPFNVYPLLDDQMRTNHPDIMVPAALVTPEKDLSRADLRRRNIRAIVDEKNELVKAKGSDIEMAAIVTIKRYGVLSVLAKLSSQSNKESSGKRRPFGRKRAQKSPKTLQKFNFKRLPIVDIAETCKEALTSNGVANVRILDEKGMEAFQRGTWDNADMTDFYRQQHSKTLGEYSHWPAKKISVTHNTATFDNTTHTVLRITGLPGPSLPSFMRQLHALGSRWYSVTLVGETISSTGDYLALNRITSVSAAIAEGTGSDTGMKTQRKLDAVQERQARVSNLKYLHLYNILLCITDPDPEKVENDAADVSRDLEGLLGISTHRISGESFQIPAVWSSRGGINML